MKKGKYRAAIIGAGKIGAFFDTPKSDKILTHAHGYAHHPHFELAAFVDADFKNAEKAAKIWNAKAYRNLAELFAKEVIDVVSVCVPDELHYSVLLELTKYTVLGGIVEKPLTTSLADSRAIIKHQFYKTRPFLLNYMRRYVPEFQTIAEKIKSKKYGRLIVGTITHGRGLLHNGSHLIDLLICFGLTVKKARSLSKVNDFYPEDWSHSSLLDIKGGGTVHLNIVPASHYRLFEMDLIFERGRIKMVKDGFVIEEYLVANDDVFAGYKVLKLAKTHQTKLGSALAYTVDNLYKALIGREPVRCSLADGYTVQKVCDLIKHG